METQQLAVLSQRAISPNGWEAAAKGSLFCRISFSSSFSHLHNSRFYSSLLDCRRLSAARNDDATSTSRQCSDYLIFINNRLYLHARPQKLEAREMGDLGQQLGVGADVACIWRYGRIYEQSSDRERIPSQQHQLARKHTRDDERHWLQLTRCSFSKPENFADVFSSSLLTAGEPLTGQPLYF